MPVTIADLSKHLNLSVSTVSKALNGYPDVAERTRVRVFAAARELDYYPSAAARSLRRQKTNKIGMLSNYPISRVGDYVAQLITGAAVAAEEEGYNLVLYATLGNKSAADQFEQMRQICRAREVDGMLILWASRMDETIRLMESESLPFIVVARRVPNPQVSFVVADNFNGARQLTHHLIEQGHQRIAFTSFPELGENAIDRLAGYRQALEEVGLPYDESLVFPITMAVESRYEAFEAMFNLATPPSAIFAFNDPVAIVALQMAAQRGLRVPNDIAIAGFDGMYASLLTTPSLTTVQHPVPTLGKEAVEALLARIRDRSLPPHRTILPVELKIRQSTVR